jgi:hypothetical protein
MTSGRGDSCAGAQTDPQGPYQPDNLELLREFAVLGAVLGFLESLNDLLNGTFVGNRFEPDLVAIGEVISERVTTISDVLVPDPKRTSMSGDGDV